MIVSAQMVYGSKQAWLPAFVMDRSVERRHSSARSWNRIIPRLIQLERLDPPALLAVLAPTGRPHDRHHRADPRHRRHAADPARQLASAFSTALLGLALSERDGILFAIGGAISLVSMAVIAAVVGTAGFATHALYSWLF